METQRTFIRDNARIEHICPCLCSGELTSGDSSGHFGALAIDHDLYLKRIEGNLADTGADIKGDLR